MNPRCIFSGLFLCGCVMLLGGCAPRLSSVSVTGVVEDTPAIAQEKDRITLTLQTQQWDFYPRDLARFFTPIHVGMRNELDRAVVVTLNSFVLKDEHGIAYYPIAPDNLVRVFYRVGEQPTPRRTPMMPQDSALPGRSQRPPLSRRAWLRNPMQPAVYRGASLHVEHVYHYGYYGYCYAPPPVYYAPQSAEVQNTPLMLFAFKEGVIPPQTQRSGYLFFQKVAEIGPHLTLHVHVQSPVHPHQTPSVESSVEFRVPLALRRASREAK